MNARDGMRRLRAERRAYGLCIRCGMRLPKNYSYRTCSRCRYKESSRTAKDIDAEDNNAENNDGIKS